MGGLKTNKIHKIIDIKSWQNLNSEDSTKIAHDYTVV